MTDAEAVRTVNRIQWSLALMRPPIEDHDALLFEYLPAVLGLTIPDWPMCRNHAPPATAVRKALTYDMDTCRAEFAKLLIIANRTGGKSFVAALIEWMMARAFDRFEGRILGGSADQSKECYKHAVAFCEGLDYKLMDCLKSSPQTEVMEFANRSLIRCLKASQTSVRGGHPNHLVIDELDEVARDIYEAAQSMPHRRRTAQIPKQLIMTSTINRAGGLVERLVREKDARGLEVVTYCWKEVTRTCRQVCACEQCKLFDYCGGDLKAVKDCIVVNVDDALDEVRVAVPWNGGHHETVIQREDIEDAGDLTQGDRVKVRGNPHGFLEVTDVADIFDMISEETWESEWCCLLRQPLGAVLKRTQIDSACVSMEYSREEPKALDRRMTHTWLGIDWGYRNETCVVCFQWDGKNDLRVIGEAHWTEKTGEELADMIKALADRWGATEAWADAADPSKISALRKVGVTVHSVAFGAWKDRCLEALRVWLQRRDERNLSINANLSHLIGALINWRYKDNVVNEEAEVAIVKRDDHPCDAMLAGMKRFARRRSPRAVTGEQVDTVPHLKGTIEDLLN